MVQTDSLRSDSVEMVTGNADSSVNDCGYICNGYVLCNRLGRFAKPHFFLVIFILLGLIHGIAETFFTETILSTNFDVPYNITRWLILGSEIFQLIVALPIVYLGAGRNRPGWLAGCMTFLAISAILFASQLLTETHKSSLDYTEYRTQKDPLLCNIWLDRYVFRRRLWYWLTLVLITLLHFGVGISKVAYWTFGIAFIDDNSKPKSSPPIIGLALALKQYGPFIGTLAKSLSLDNFFTGIYWSVIAVLTLIFAIITGMFPSKLLDSKGNLFLSAVQQNGDSGFVPALRRLLTNKVIILSGLSMMFLFTVIFNAAAIEDEYIESVFYVPVSNYSLFSNIFSFQYLFSISKPTMAAVAIFSSGLNIYLMRPRASFLCLWSVIGICIAAGCFFGLIFLKCSKTPIHREDSSNNLIEYCNINCDCSDRIPFTPVCATYDPYVYYSPCHAGCSTSYGSGGNRVFSNCSCVSTGQVQGGQCTKGSCDVYYWLFQTMTLIIISALSTGFMGSLTICFRSILPRDKSMMVGIITVLSGFAARVPFKYLYDFVTKFSCIYSVGGLCKIYGSEKLATYFHLLNICFLLVAAGMLALLSFLVQDLQLYDSQPPVKSASEPETATEMTDFRSQLNQALKARREIAAEEQELLSEGRRATVSKKQSNGKRTSLVENDEKQKSSEGYDNGNRTSLIDDERPRSSSIRDRDLKPIIKPAVLPKPSTSSFKPQRSPINSTPSETPPLTPPGTTIKKEGFLTTLL